MTLPDRVRRAFPGARVEALGGATEATVWSNWFPVGAVDPAWPSIPYGRPIANARYHVLDAAFTPSPIGVPGALYIGGDCLCAGYARAELTAEAFLPDPLSGIPGARLYRTGDQARYEADGNLEFLGRLDQQVKVRGFRIELGEIEIVLARHPGVRDCVVLAPESARGDRRLVAYVVPRGAALDTAALRQHLRQRLPEPMVPAALVSVGALPLTSNGKVDRQALVRMAPEDERPAGELAGPRTPVEELLAGIWMQVLQRERVSIDESFFELGGHSLLATQVTSRIKEVFGVAMPLSDLFAAPTVAGLAVRIETLRSAGTAPSRPPLVLADRSRPLPASFAQQRLWFLDQLDPGSPLYNVPAAVVLGGRLGIAALAAALTHVVARHEVLRTSFGTVGGEPVQIVAASAVAALPLIDLRRLPAMPRASEAERLAAAEARRPFDLGRGPLMRAALLCLAAERHVLLLTMHHIVCDGWSRGVLVEELNALYAACLAGRPSPLPPLPFQYADFAAWQRQWLAGETLAEQLNHWTRHLHGAPPSLALPFDRPRPAMPSHRGAAHWLRVPQPATAALKALGRGEGTTLFMTMLAAFSILLHRLSGQSDLVIGSNIANRQQRNLEGLIGLFANTVALRIAWSEAVLPTVRELLAHVREVVLEAQAYQELPFEKLVEVLRPERDDAVHPLFQVALVMQQNAARSAAPSALAAGELPIEVRLAKFDLTLFVAEEAGQVVLELEYDTDLFDAGTIADLAGQLATLLTGLPGLIDRPISAVPLVSAPESGTLVGAFAEDVER